MRYRNQTVVWRRTQAVGDHGRVLDENYVEELRALGVAHGLDALGVAAAEPFTSTRQDLEDRKAAGLNGSMQFTYRKPSRSSDPSVTLATAASLVVAAHRYHRADSPSPHGEQVALPVPEPMGRVARYARRDHYAALRSGLDVVAERLRADGWAAKVVLDDNALVDREAAVRAGLGWYGKSSNVLLSGQGSWFVLGSVLTDAPLPPARRRVADGCGSCRRCLASCPTGAIIAPGVVDARRCLAWSVQADGPFPRDQRVALGDRLYGCDDCQEVCPPNLRVGRAASSSTAECTADDGVPLLPLLDADDAELLARYGRWYIPRRDPRYLRRNALVVLGNTARSSDPAVAATLTRYLSDPDPMLRAHAVWAVCRLGRADLITDERRADDAVEVREELAADPPPARGSGVPEASG